MPALTLSRVGLTWPDGTPLFTDLTFAIPDGLTGVIGRNGIGKSTLIRLLQGDLAPTSGAVARAGTMRHVPQDVTLTSEATVAQALGIAARLDALRAIEAGSADPVHYDTLNDDWTVESRAHEVLASLGLALDLDRPATRMSGGEATLLHVGAALLADPDVLILDEPTNNLDEDAREALTARLRSRRGATLVVTHDRALLSHVDRIVELREREDRTTELRVFGGALEAFEEARRVERDAAEQAVTSASSQVNRQSAALVAHVEGAGRKRRAGERAVAQGRYPGIVAGGKKRQAERTDARVRAVHEARLSEARDRLEQARAAIPRDRRIHIDLPGTEVPARRLVLEASLTTRTGAALEALVQGPERIHIRGGNGSGKTTLLRTLLGELTPEEGQARLLVPHGVLRQRLDVLDDARSVVDNVRDRAPEASAQEVRDRLGRFRFRGAVAEAPVGTLSGGERFRAALACVLLARPEPQLLVLDEPTNNLDLDSQAELVEALADFRGAMLVVSHDQAFVDALGVTRRWTMPGEPGAVEDVSLG